jgi:acetyl/propionyl-CoA carboxylase alpha subunit
VAGCGARAFSIARPDPAPPPTPRPAGAVYLEKFFAEPRQVEVLVMGDSEGNVVQHFERECSIQRRRQKLIEEASSLGIDQRTRGEMAAARLAETAEYANAATMEFLVDEEGSFYVIEINTRIHVEHPITEAVTGVGLVKEQLKVAGGEGLSVRQEDVAVTGHAMEFRINAEDPHKVFFPRPERLPPWRSRAAPACGWTRRSSRGTRYRRSTTRWSVSSSSGLRTGKKRWRGGAARSPSTAWRG